MTFGSFSWPFAQKSEGFLGLCPPTFMEWFVLLGYDVHDEQDAKTIAIISNQSLLRKFIERSGERNFL